MKRNRAQKEAEVLALRRRFGQQLSKTVIEGQEAKQPVVAPKCPQCGEAMRYKDPRTANLESRLGTLAVVRRVLRGRA